MLREEPCGQSVRDCSCSTGKRTSQCKVKVRTKRERELIHKSVPKRRQNELFGNAASVLLLGVGRTLMDEPFAPFGEWAELAFRRWNVRTPKWLS